MSKKTRKKSSTKPRKKPVEKSAAAKAARGGSGGKPKTARARKAKVKKPARSGKAIVKKSGKAAKSDSAKESHKPASKQLKSNQSSAPATTRAKAAETGATVIKASERQAAPGAILVEGAKAPSFRLQRDGGATVSLAEYAGRKLVLFFYPRADTPGCTREAIDFTRLRDAFAEAGAAVLGVSADPMKAQESFRDKHELTVPLLSDEQHGMLEAYGAWGEKSMYGRNFMGIIRTTVLIGADGRVAKVWRNVRVDGHANEVLAATREL
jgi:peroxiredoxin Q/BCP